MKNKIVTKVVASVLALAMMVTVGDCGVTYAASGSVTVSTQKQLNAALKNKKVERVTIKTKKAATFRINSVKGYKKLIVDAPKATVVNKCKLNTEIDDAKKYIEKRSGNEITVFDENKLDVNVGAGVKVWELEARYDNDSALTLSGSGTINRLYVYHSRAFSVGKGVTVKLASVYADTSWDIDGEVQRFYLMGDTYSEVGPTLNLSGETTAVPEISAESENCKIVTDIKVDVDSTSPVDVVLNGDAEGSTIKMPVTVTEYAALADVTTTDLKYRLPNTIQATVDGKTVEVPVDYWQVVSGDADIYEDYNSEMDVEDCDVNFKHAKSYECVVKPKVYEYYYIAADGVELPTMKVTYTGGTSNNTSTGTTSEDADESSSASSGKITI